MALASRIEGMDRGEGGGSYLDDDPVLARVTMALSSGGNDISQIVASGSALSQSTGAQMMNLLATMMARGEENRAAATPPPVTTSTSDGGGTAATIIGGIGAVAVGLGAVASSKGGKAPTPTIPAGKNETPKPPATPAPTEKVEVAKQEPTPPAPADKVEAKKQEPTPPATPAPKKNSPTPKPKKQTQNAQTPPPEAPKEEPPVVKGDGSVEVKPENSNDSTEPKGTVNLANLDSPVTPGTPRKKVVVDTGTASKIVECPLPNEVTLIPPPIECTLGDAVVPPV